MASESGGDAIPFITYALNGFLVGLKSQLAHIGKLQMEFAWLNYIHDSFRHESSKAAHRQKALLLDLFAKEGAVPIAKLISCRRGSPKPTPGCIREPQLEMSRHWNNGDC
jgi:hypothetical protein